MCVYVCRKEVVRSLAITSILRHSWNALIFAQLGTFCRTSFLAGASQNSASPEPLIASFERYHERNFIKPKLVRTLLQKRKARFAPLFPRCTFLQSNSPRPFAFSSQFRSSAAPRRSNTQPPPPSPPPPPPLPPFPSAQFPSCHLRSRESAKVLRQRVYNESERAGKNSGTRPGEAEGRRGRDRKARFDHRYS